MRNKTAVQTKVTKKLTFFLYKIYSLSLSRLKQMNTGEGKFNLNKNENIK